MHLPPHTSTTHTYHLHTDRIAATLQLLLFFFIALFAFPPDSFPINPQDSAAGIQPTSYFQLPVLMLMLITLLNDGTLISVAYDRVTPSERPEKWNLKVVCEGWVGGCIHILWLLCCSFIMFFFVCVYTCVVACT